MKKTEIKQKAREKMGKEADFHAWTKKITNNMQTSTCRRRTT
jgi:hypothetical protein